MTPQLVFLASGFAFALCVGVVSAIVPLLKTLGVLDIPNQRSSHDRPVPRGGGIGIIAGIIGGCGVLLFGEWSTFPWMVAASCSAVFVLGAAEDLGADVSPGIRLGIQVLAASVAVWSLGPLSRLPLPPPLDFLLGPLAWPLTLIWIVGVTNIFNFLDGIDGYAGLQGVVAGAAMAIVGYGWTGGVGVVAAAACVGFLVHNWHPASVFMGDVGSLTLGFMFAVLPLGLGGKSHVGVFVMGMALWFFLADGAFTILRRLRWREKIWEAHRSHLYQRLTIAGWSHSKVVFAVAGGMLLVATVAVTGVATGSTRIQWLAVGVAVAFFAGYWMLVRRVEVRARGRGLPPIIDRSHINEGKR